MALKNTVSIWIMADLIVHLYQNEVSNYWLDLFKTVVLL